ncbi:cellulose synthase-like protein D1 [Corchorus olitorius]|uniref:Cellulose synthase-like protein D1 n=1 Tax=Corchorus olitorius TaxID=93759 RepID=A0A1R3GI67_9ROSI|nr:cellulose synthase-like protein D1 [Corchorus olitorius]
MESDSYFFNGTQTIFNNKNLRWKRRAYLYLNRVVILVPLLLRAFDRFSGATYVCPKVTMLIDLLLCCVTCLRLFPDLSTKWTGIKFEALLSVFLSLPPWSPGNVSPLFWAMLQLASPFPVQAKVRHVNRAYD